MRTRRHRCLDRSCIWADSLEETANGARRLTKVGFGWQQMSTGVSSRPEGSHQLTLRFTPPLRLSCFPDDNHVPRSSTPLTRPDLAHTRPKGYSMNRSTAWTNSPPPGNRSACRKSGSPDIFMEGRRRRRHLEDWVQDEAGCRLSDPRCEPHRPTKRESVSP